MDASRPTTNRMELLAPLERAFGRMKATLLRPFDLGKWIVLGFSCWLAGFVERSGSSGAGFQWSPDDGDDTRRALESLGEAETWTEGADRVVQGLGLEALVAWLSLTGVAILVGIFLLIGIALLWVGSRAQFVYLDNVLANKAEIRAPWTRFAAQGNSLFLFVLALFAIGGLTLVPLGLLTAVGMVGGLSGSGAPLSVGLMSFGLLIVCVLVFLLLRLFLFDFVVPIMLSRRIGVLEAWRVFLPVMRNHLGAFVLYALFCLFLGILFVAAVFALGFMTCCVGFLLLATPFLSTLLLLPVYVTFRWFSVEYLSQAMPELNLLRTAVPNHAPAGSPTT